MVDWQCREAEIAYQMLRAAMATGRFPDVETWSLSLDPKMRAALIRTGFRRVERTDTKSHPAAGPLIIRVSETGRDGEFDCV